MLIQRSLVITRFSVRPLSVSVPFTAGTVSQHKLNYPIVQRLQHLGSIVQDWWSSLRETILQMAVPKKKTSHSKKRMRSAHKGLDNSKNLVPCPGCGMTRMRHHVCLTCFERYERENGPVAPGMPNRHQPKET